MMYDQNGKPFDYHQPGAVLDYGFNWTPWLQADEEIMTSVWSVEPTSNVTLERDQVVDSNRRTSVFLRGGDECTAYLLTNTITTTRIGTTTEMRVDSRNITLYCEK